MITQNHIQQESRRKNIGFTLIFFLAHPPYSPDLAPSDFFFILGKMLRMTKNFFQEDQVKMFVENFLSFK